MLSILDSHTAVSAFKQLTRAVRRVGIRQTVAVLVSVIDDRCLRFFDRRYRVKTSGYILLTDTSFDAQRLRDATQYGPVNAWAFRSIYNS